MIATLFSERYPEKVESLILAGALFSQQETYNNILQSIHKVSKINNDTLNLMKIKKTQGLDKNSAEYRKACFELASENNYFKMPKPTSNSEKLRLDYNNNISINNIRNHDAPLKFYKNETLKNIDTKSTLRGLKGQIKIYAIYGKEDRIFGESQFKEIKKIVGRNQFTIINNCSHFLFVDQQEVFIDNIVNWLKK